MQRRLDWSVGGRPCFFMRTLKPILIASAVLVASVSVAGPDLDASTSSTADATTVPAFSGSAIDAHAQIRPAEFLGKGKGVWESSWHQGEFPFDELIYYWNARPERGEGFRLYLQVRFPGDEESPWLYAGYWGKVMPYAHGEREKPKFEKGLLDLDQLLLKEKALAWRFRVTSEGERALSARPLIGVITTDNKPSPEMLAMWENRPKEKSLARVLDVPLRKQEDVAGNPFPDRCQSAAVASAMQYLGTTVPLEQIIAMTTDPEYKTFGIWPRTINTAYEFGFEAYLDRFRDWESVKATVAANKVILCSITMPKDDTYLAPPYPSISGHIVALCGVTDDGRVIVTDSAKKGGYLTQWKREDFEKIWMRNKGGVGMVIAPPKDTPVKLVADLPAFPDRNTTGTASRDEVTTGADETTSSTK